MQQGTQLVNASRRVVRPRVRTGRRARTAVAVAGVALALTGCTATSPQQTATPFEAGEGRNARIGGTDENSGIKLRNFLLVSNAQGGPGQVVGAISNQTDNEADVQLAVVTTTSDGQQQAAGQTVVKVPAGGFVQVGSPSAGTGSATPAAPPRPARPARSSRSTSRRCRSRRVRWSRWTLAPPPSEAPVQIPVPPASGYYEGYLPSGSATSQPSTVTPSGSLSPSANPSGAGQQSPSPAGSATGAAS